MNHYDGLRGLESERVRLLAAAATVVNLHLMYYTALPLRENLVTFLLAATLVGFLRAFRDRSTRTLVAATGAFSLLVHTDARFLPLLVGLPIFGRLAGGTWPWRSTAIAWVITGLLLIPYTVRNVAATGRPVILTERALGKWAPRALGRSNDPSIDASGSDRAQWLANWERDKRDGRDAMTEHERNAFDAGARPATGVGAVIGARWIEYWRIARVKPGYLSYPDGRFAPTWSRRHHGASAFTTAPILLLLPFFLMGASGNERRTLLALAAFVASHALLHALVHARERYRVPVEPWLAVLAASAAMGLVSAVRRRLRGRSKAEALSRSA
jgi:hypothetical protein